MHVARFEIKIKKIPTQNVTQISSLRLLLTLAVTRDFIDRTSIDTIHVILTVRRKFTNPCRGINCRLSLRAYICASGAIPAESCPVTRFHQFYGRRRIMGEWRTRVVRASVNFSGEGRLRFRLSETTPSTMGQDFRGDNADEKCIAPRWKCIVTIWTAWSVFPSLSSGNGRRCFIVSSRAQEGEICKRAGSRLPSKKLVSRVNACEMEENATGRVKYWQIFKCVGKRTCEISRGTTWNSYISFYPGSSVR